MFKLFESISKITFIKKPLLKKVSRGYNFAYNRAEENYKYLDIIMRNREKTKGDVNNEKK